MADPAKDFDDRPSSRIEKVTLGELAGGGKLAWVLFGALSFVAAAVVTLLAMRFETKADAKATNERQDAAINKTVNALEVEQALRVYLIEEVRGVRAQVDKIADKVRAEKVPKGGR